MGEFGQFVPILFAAVVVEAIVQYFFKDLPFTPDEYKDVVLRFISVAVGVAVAFNLGIDVFLIAGYESKIPYFGTIITGALAGRGSNYIHDFMKLIIEATKVMKK